MSVKEALSVFIIIITLWLFVMTTIKYAKQTVSLKSYFQVLIPLLFAIVLFAYCFEPNELFRWDLIEHHKILDQMKEMGFERALTDGRYKNLFVINFYFALISTLPNYGLLPAIPLTIDFLIFIYIFKESTEDKKLNCGQLSFIVLAYLTTMGLMLAISGIRCVLSVSLTALAIYQEMIKGKKIAYIIYLASIFIHYFAIILVVLRILSALRSKIVVFITFVLFIVVGIDALSNLTPSLSSSYMAEGITTFLYEYKLYTIWSYFPGLTLAGKLNFINQVLVVCYLYYMCRSILKKSINLSDRERKIISFCSSVYVTGFVFCLNFLLLQRFIYLIAFCYTMILPIYFRTQNYRNSNVNVLFGLVFTWMLFFNEIYSFIVNYVGYWFITLG